MVKIQCTGDIVRANIPKCIRDYFSEYIQLILSKYQTDNLQKIGCVYFLENVQDTRQHQQMGLSLPIQETPFEYGELIRLNDSHGERELLHGCYVFNNDFAIDIFGERNIFSEDMVRSLLDT